MYQVKIVQQGIYLNARLLRSRELSYHATTSNSSLLNTYRFIPLIKYWRNNMFVFFFGSPLRWAMGICKVRFHACSIIKLFMLRHLTPVVISDRQVRYSPMLLITLLKPYTTVLSRLSVNFTRFAIRLLRSTWVPTAEAFLSHLISSQSQCPRTTRSSNSGRSRWMLTILGVSTRLSPPRARALRNLLPCLKLASSSQDFSTLLNLIKV